MKKAILMVMLSAGIGIASQAQVRFGLHADGIGAGGTIESKDPDNGNMKLKMKTRFSWKAGIVADVPLAQNLSFMPQLNLLSKGGKVDHTFRDWYEGIEYQIKTKAEPRLTYLELPLNLTYHQSNFFLGAGPSISYGIGGKGKSSVITTVDGEVIQKSEESGKVKFDGKKNMDTDVHLKAVEFGANVTAGYQLSNGVFLQASYNIGLSNIDPNEDSKWKNHYFGIGIGYFFNKK